MKISAILCVSALALAPLALAKISITPQALGQVEGTLNFCSEANPKAKAKYDEWAKLFVNEATEDELKEIRDSSEYKDAYDSITAELAKVPKDKALEACTSFAEKQ